MWLKFKFRSMIIGSSTVLHVYILQCLKLTPWKIIFILVVCSYFMLLCRSTKCRYNISLMNWYQFYTSDFINRKFKIVKGRCALICHQSWVMNCRTKLSLSCDTVIKIKINAYTQVGHISLWRIYIVRKTTRCIVFLLARDRKP
jgi:hypothetical protein